MTALDTNVIVRYLTQDDEVQFQKVLQMLKGAARNEKDAVLRGIKDVKARDSVIVDFAAIKDSKAGELAAKFDIVMGFTPTDMGH